MIQVSPALAVPTPAPVRAASPVSGGIQGFAAALAGAVAPGAGQASPASEDKLPGVAGRQRHAAGGKELPVSVDGEVLTEVTGETGSGSDEDEGAADTPFAWFAVAPVAPEPAPIVVKLPVAGASALAVEGDSAAPVPELEVPGGAFQPEGTGAAEIATQPAAPTDLAVGTGLDAPAPAAEVPGIEAPVAPKEDGSARPSIKLTADFQPVRAAPRVQVPLAEALHRPETNQPGLAEQLLAGIEAPAPRRQTARDIAFSAMSQALQPDAPRPNILQAVAPAQQPVLDTSRQQWMAEMIETVAALRETPNSRETTIRLSPDALGTVDVSIRQEGDRVHVRIVAETPAARQLLNEAQPRLMELAEARGIRLGQTSVDTGHSGPGHQRQEQHAPATPLHNPPAPAAEAETKSDASRVA